MVVNRSAATGENLALVASLSSEVVDPSSSESELTSSLDSDAGAGCGATVDSRFRAAHAVNDMAPARLSDAAVTNRVEQKPGCARRAGGPAQTRRVARVWLEWGVPGNSLVRPDGHV